MFSEELAYVWLPEIQRGFTAPPLVKDSGLQHQITFEYVMHVAADWTVLQTLLTWEAEGDVKSCQNISFLYDLAVWDWGHATGDIWSPEWIFSVQAFQTRHVHISESICSYLHLNWYLWEKYVAFSTWSSKTFSWAHFSIKGRLFAYCIFLSTGCFSRKHPNNHWAAFETVPGQLWWNVSATPILPEPYEKWVEVMSILQILFSFETLLRSSRSFSPFRAPFHAHCYHYQARSNMYI